MLANKFQAWRDNKDFSNHNEIKQQCLASKYIFFMGTSSNLSLAEIYMKSLICNRRTFEDTQIQEKQSQHLLH